MSISCGDRDYLHLDDPTVFESLSMSRREEPPTPVLYRLARRAASLGTS